MARRYSEMPGEDEADIAPSIVGQVSGPKSWSEYDTSPPPDDMNCDMGRRNCTELEEIAFPRPR